MRFALLTLIIAALSLALFGIWFLFWPDSGWALFEVGALEAGVRAEMRAIYGGLELALAIMLLRTASRAEWRALGLELACLVFAGLALGRAYGLLLGDPSSSFMLQALGLEAGLAVLSLVARLRLGSAPRKI